MAIQNSTENYPQVVITPNRNVPRPSPHTERNITVGRVMPQATNPAPTTTAGAAHLGKGNTEEGGETGFWGRDGFTFGDLLDLINPLQHIPVVSTIYRAVTGDEIGIGPRLLGGAVLGGVIGFGASAINAAIEYETGKDAGDHALIAMGLAENAEVSVASVQHVNPKDLLSAADPVGQMAAAIADIPSAPVEAAQELTEQEAAALLLAQHGAAPAMLDAPSKAKDSRAMYQLGAMENAAQQYQQAQNMDKLQNLALAMDLEG
ncbi:MAG: hypothetical protein MK052_09280 [Alphaproteobacteria bacterium]|nr:hypothetical protein [Alphaproteobacteria bacterium]